MFICLSVCKFACLSIQSSVSLFVLFACLIHSFCMSLRMFVCPLFVCLYVCPSVCSNACCLSLNVECNFIWLVANSCYGHLPSPDIEQLLEFLKCFLRAFFCLSLFSNRSLNRFEWVYSCRQFLRVSACVCVCFISIQVYLYLSAYVLYMPMSILMLITYSVCVSYTIFSADRTRYTYTHSLD